MGYAEFSNQLVSEIYKRLQEMEIEAEVIQQQMRKNNDTLKDAIAIKGVSDMVPIIYPAELYDSYKDGKDMGDIVSFAVSTLDSGPIMDIEPDRVGSWEEVKDKVILQAVGAEENQERAANIPFRKVEDMLLTYRVLVGISEQGIASIPITNWNQNTWGVTEEELYQVGVQNTPRLLPLEFKSMMTMMQELMSGEFGQEDLGGAVEEPPMYILTNTYKSYGATALFYPDAMDEIAQFFGKDMVVLPSSINEVIILPHEPEGGMAIKDFKEMVTEINRTQVTPEEKLADQVYMWDKEQKKLLIADKWQEQKLAKLEPEKASIRERIGQKKEQLANIPMKAEAKGKRMREAGMEH